VTPSAPGWYPDPTGRHESRYWSGFRWTRHVADGRHRGEDPLAAERQPGPSDPPLTPSSRPSTGVRTQPARRVDVPDVTTRSDGQYGPEQPRRGRWLVATAVVGVVAVLVAGGLLLLGGDGDGDETTTETSGSNDDALEAYLVEFNLRASSNTIDENQANCMADNMIAVIGRDRFMEVGVLDQDNPFEVLTRDETVRAVKTGFDCLEDEDIVEYMAATWNPERFGGIPDEVAPCLYRGWLQGWGRDRLGDVVGNLVIADDAPEIGELLTAEENEVFSEVLTSCLAENGVTTTAPLDAGDG
jgi:uncharacterized protein DUF2510